MPTKPSQDEERLLPHDFGTHQSTSEIVQAIFGAYLYESIEHFSDPECYSEDSDYEPYAILELPPEEKQNSETSSENNNAIYRTMQQITDRSTCTECLKTIPKTSNHCLGCGTPVGQTISKLIEISHINDGQLRVTSSSKPNHGHEREESRSAAVGPTTTAYGPEPTCLPPVPPASANDKCLRTRTSNQCLQPVPTQPSKDEEGPRPRAPAPKAALAAKVVPKRESPDADESPSQKVSRPRDDRSRSTSQKVSRPRDDHHKTRGRSPPCMNSNNPERPQTKQAKKKSSRRAKATTPNAAEPNQRRPRRNKSTSSEDESEAEGEGKNRSRSAAKAKKATPAPKRAPQCRIQRKYGAKFDSLTPTCTLKHALSFTRVVSLAQHDGPMCHDCLIPISPNDACCVCFRCDPLYLLCVKCTFATDRVQIH